MMTEVLAGTVVVTLLIVVLTIGLLLARRVLVPEGIVAITVNDSRTLVAARGEALLPALHRAGIAVPAACGGNGTCGLCRVTVRGAGAGEPKATERALLLPAERHGQMRLACQVTLRGPVQVEVPEAVFQAETFTCRIVSNRMLAPLITELVLEVPEGTAVRFRPGGYMQLRAPAYELDLATLPIDDRFAEIWRIARWNRLRAHAGAPVARAYSVANRPQDAGRLVFNVRLAVPPAGREGDIPPGMVSSWLFARQAGDEVSASGPFGDFHVQPTSREAVFVGGGVGMAPLRAMIHAELQQGTARPMRYYYGARTLADLFYVEEFEHLAAMHGNFAWAPALSDPMPGDRWTGQTGFIHEALRRGMAGHPAPEECEYYLCGPPVMISAVIATLESLGVDRSAIFNDEFGS